jgi:hypothetical protein
MAVQAEEMYEELGFGEAEGAASLRREEGFEGGKKASARRWKPPRFEEDSYDAMDSSRARVRGFEEANSRNSKRRREGPLEEMAAPWRRRIPTILSGPLLGARRALPSSGGYAQQRRSSAFLTPTPRSPGASPGSPADFCRKQSPKMRRSKPLPSLPSPTRAHYLSRRGLLRERSWAGAVRPCPPLRAARRCAR